MRWKIIAVNSAVVIIVGVLLYALLRAQFTDLVSNRSRIQANTQRAVAALDAQLQLDGLRVERWLDMQSDDPAMREPLLAGTQSARSGATMKLCDSIKAAAEQTPSLLNTPPAIVALVDAHQAPARLDEFLERPHAFAADPALVLREANARWPQLELDLAQ